MLRRFIFLVLLLVPFAMTGCGDGSPDAPLDTQAHPAAWLSNHPGAALSSPSFADCISCHGNDLSGNGSAVSCYSCHAFNATPPFVTHPAAWADTYSDHRIYAARNGFTACGSCHGADLTGSAAAPSCFSASVNGLDCHAAGPVVVTHSPDYANGAVHGPVAEQDLTYCQACHGEVGGPGSNPRFNIGISGSGCEGCHGVNYAHPATWGIDPSATYHNGAGNIANACTLCHGVALDGAGGVGISCFTCHGASPADNPSGCLSCHSQPPAGLAPVGNVSPNRPGQHQRIGHSQYISTVPGETCSRCHLGAGSGTAAHFDGTNPADVVFDHPDPTDDISAVSDGTNTTCTGSCHFTSPLGDTLFLHNNATWY